LIYVWLLHIWQASKSEDCYVSWERILDSPLHANGCPFVDFYGRMVASPNSENRLLGAATSPTTSRPWSLQGGASHASMYEISEDRVVAFFVLYKLRHNN
jgi:hypothetical protein